MSYKSKILIVDDDPAGRRAMEAPLLAGDYDLVLAQDGPEALELAHALQPDLILLDVMMPGMDGYEVCRRLRADLLLAVETGGTPVFASQLPAGASSVPLSRAEL